MCISNYKCCSYLKYQGFQNQGRRICSSKVFLIQLIVFCNYFNSDLLNRLDKNEYFAWVLGSVKNWKVCQISLHLSKNSVWHSSMGANIKEETPRSEVKWNLLLKETAEARLSAHWRRFPEPQFPKAMGRGLDDIPPHTHTELYYKRRILSLGNPNLLKWKVNILVLCLGGRHCSLHKYPWKDNPEQRVLSCLQDAYLAYKMWRNVREPWITVSQKADEKCSISEMWITQENELQLRLINLW